jgi:membrane protein required for colicin V production
VADHGPAWVNNAKSKPFLDSMVVKLQSVLPEEFAQMVRTSVMDKVLPPSENTGNANAPAADQAPADDAAPAAPAAPAQPQSN